MTRIKIYFKLTTIDTQGGEGGAGKVGKHGHQNIMKHENTDPHFFSCNPKYPLQKNLPKTLKTPPPYSEFQRICINATSVVSIWFPTRSIERVRFSEFSGKEPSGILFKFLQGIT